MRDAIALVRPGGTYLSLQRPAPADWLAEQGVTGRFFIVTPGRDSLSRLRSEVDSRLLRVTIAASFPLGEGRAAFASGTGPDRPPGKTVLVVRGPADQDGQR